MRSCHLLLLSAVSLVVGCGDAASGPSAPAPADRAGPAPPAPVPPPVTPPPVAAPPVTPPPAAPVMEKASDDLTKKGIAAKEIGKGILATPTSTYLRIQDRAIFLSVEAAMNLYKGEHGDLPKSHDAFMRDIIQANNIHLPELPDDSKYVYLPDQGELMIERRAMQ